VDHLDAVTEGKSPDGEAEKRQVIARIKEEIERLNELVTNFILYGRPPKLHRGPVRLPELAEGGSPDDGGRLVRRRSPAARSTGRSGKFSPTRISCGGRW